MLEEKGGLRTRTKSYQLRGDGSSEMWNGQLQTETGPVHSLFIHWKEREDRGGGSILHWVEENSNRPPLTASMSA